MTLRMKSTPRMMTIRRSPSKAEIRRSPLVIDFELILKNAHLVSNGSLARCRPVRTNPPLHSIVSSKMLELCLNQGPDIAVLEDLALRLGCFANDDIHHGLC